MRHILSELEKRIELNRSKYELYLDEEQLIEALDALEQNYIDLPNSIREKIDELLISPDRFFDNFEDYYDILVRFDPDRGEMTEEETIGVVPSQYTARLIGIYLMTRSNPSKLKNKK